MVETANLSAQGRVASVEFMDCIVDAVTRQYARSIETAAQDKDQQST